MKSPTRSFVLVLGAVTGAPGLCQSVLFDWTGDSAVDEFGRSVSSAGDVNGDGFPDLIVGADGDDNNGTGSGSARVFSGLDGSILYTFDGDSPSDRFGFSVSGAGDVDGDGLDDLIVGAFQDDNHGSNSGSARVLSGLDGGILHAFDGDSPNDLFGLAVSGAGDVNGDGFDDLIVGAYHDDNNGTSSGSARVFSGVDGSVLHTFDGDSAGDSFGYRVSGAGDVNGDGFDDLVVGAFEDDNNGTGSGSARVFSGVNGSILHTFDGDSPGDFFGWSVSGAGDVNADGFDDVVVGAPQDDNNGFSSGSARIFSGVDGSILYTFAGDSEQDFFGGSVSGAGDVNGDGFDDLVVGAGGDDNNGQLSGSARVFSGVDGSILYTLDGDSVDDQLGRSVSGAGDVNGDGFDDLIVGIPRTESGSARVFSGHDTPIGSNYCGPAFPNSTGQPSVISATGSQGVVNNDVTLAADQLPPGQFAYFLAGQTQGFSMPPASQGNICLTGNIGRYDRVANIIQGPTGSIRIDLTAIPVNPPVAVQPGDTWNFQCWYRDNNPGPTSNFTDAVSVTFM